MTTWTKMKITNLVEIEWADAFHKFVRCKTLYGEMPLQTADDLRYKLQSPYLLPSIRRIYEDMLDFAEKE